MQITNIKIGFMGTVEFDGLTVGMRQPQGFIVYPMDKSGEEINIQSDHRFGRLDLATGVGVMSANRAQYANGIWLGLCQARGTAIIIKLAAEDLQTLRGWIKKSGGLLVGEPPVQCDNTGAMAL